MKELDVERVSVPPMRQAPTYWHSRGYLPHFDQPGLVQMVTFRLADALPPRTAGR